MSVAVAVRTALDAGVVRDGVRPLIALRGVLEAHSHGRLAGWHCGDGDADRAPIPQPRTEVCVHRVITADAGDDRRRVCAHG